VYPYANAKGYFVEQKFVKPSKAASMLGVCVATIRQWMDNSKLKGYRTPSGHRLVSVQDIKRIAGDA
jgi:predicted site-specific integrase-resolvase